MKKQKAKRIYLSPPHLSPLELEHVQEAIQQNWVAPVGPQLQAFEKSLSDYLHQNPVVALNSGTSALHLALKLLGVGVGDEVICPTFTFVATVNPVLYQQATPIFVDSEPNTWNICPIQLEKAIQHRIKVAKKPKAIIVVHLYGQPAQMQEIQAVAQKYEIPIIEDAAEALGSSYQGQKAGTLGDLGVISFNGNKIITTSAGGALVTKTVQQAQKALFWATQAKEDAPHYEHQELGHNYRLSNVLAAIGVGQMTQLEARVARRREIFEFYQAHLPANKVGFQPEIKGTCSNRWLSCVVLNPTRTKATPEDIRLRLEAENIESRPLWKPMHLQPLFKEAPYYGGQIAEDLFNQGLCLPSGSSLTEDDLARIVLIVNEVLK
ncbi:pyridoxal phosphate-dependent aminotransferase [marine bacterium AO1-C]|nr:pyridoxal phosphate-dependent aminotransferase [marine bacterium AO1-C]